MTHILQSKLENSQFETEQTPGFGCQQYSFEIEQCLDGISEFILADNTQNLKESFHLINVSSFTNFLVDFETIANFSDSISNLDFQEIAKKKRLEIYYKRQKFPDSAILLASLHKQKPRSGLTNFSQGRIYNPKITIETEQQTCPTRNKFSRIESQYSPKNLKDYLNRAKPQSPVNDKWLGYGKIQKQQSMQKQKHTSPLNKSINSSNEGSFITLNKRKNQHNFCLITKKHAQLANSILKQQPNTDRSHIINSKYQKFISN